MFIQIIITYFLYLFIREQPDRNKVWSVILAKRNINVIFLVLHSAERHIAESSINILTWIHRCSVWGCFFFLVLSIAYISNLCSARRSLSPVFHHVRFSKSYLSFLFRYFSALAAPIEINSSTTGTIVSGIAESWVSADPPIHIPLFRTATSHRTNHFFSSHHIHDTDILARRREMAAMKPYFKPLRSCLSDTHPYCLIWMQAGRVTLSSTFYGNSVNTKLLREGNRQMIICTVLLPIYFTLLIWTMNFQMSACMCVSANMRAYLRACVHACVNTCMYSCVRACISA